MFKRYLWLSVAAVLVVVIVGCAIAPKTFIVTMEPTWATIEWKENIDYEKAWVLVSDLLIKRFDLEMINKESGYIRTNWLYSWTGRLTQNYRVRVTVKFNKEKHSVEVKSEANYMRTNGEWVAGSDTRLLETLKTDIMGSVGRVTR
jgi:hypothetical protein